MAAWMLRLATASPTRKSMNSPSSLVAISCALMRSGVTSSTAALAPGGEASGGGEVGKARVGVSEVGAKELPEALFGAGGGREERRRRAVGGQGKATGAFGGANVGEFDGVNWDGAQEKAE